MTTIPQLEDGYTRISNQIFIDLGSYRLSGEEWQILLCIFSKTYGYHKKEDWIALSQFHEFTGIKKPSIIRAIKKLVDKNIVSKKAKGSMSLYSYNKLKSTWKPLAKKLTISNKANDVYKKANGVSNKANKSLQKSYPQKIQDNITKETITKDIGTFLQMFSQVNPSYKNLFKNKTERASAQRLLEQYGMDKITNLMGQLPAIIQKPYAPSITTPYQLEIKMGQLILFMQQEKKKVNKFKVKKI